VFKKKLPMSFYTMEKQGALGKIALTRSLLTTVADSREVPIPQEVRPEALSEKSAN